MKAPPVKILAQELNIPVYQPEKLRDTTQLEIWQPDLIVVAAFGQILKKIFWIFQNSVASMFMLRCFRVGVGRHRSTPPFWLGMMKRASPL